MLQSVRPSKIIIPVLLGVGVVFYFFWQQFDIDNFKALRWDARALLWMGFAVIALCIRHFAYMMRLWLLSDQLFSLKKCFELVFIWEFSSAVSPTSFGGSAVALYVLSKEKLSGAKTTALVLYATITDNVFFVVSLPILLFFLGPNMIAPGVDSIFGGNVWATSLFTAYSIMLVMGGFLIYGTFINPKQVKYFLAWITTWGWLKRFHESAVKLGDDFIVTAKEMRTRTIWFHLSVLGTTSTAWLCRFFLVSCLIIGLTDVSTDFFTQLTIYARMKSMFIIMLVSPTPGGAGFAEFGVQAFLKDIIDPTSAITIAVIWRLMTYYLYLFVGAAVVPNWIARRLAERGESKLRNEN